MFESNRSTRSTASSSSSDEESDVESGKYVDVDDQSAQQKTGLQKFLESPGFNIGVIVAVILHVLWVIFLYTFVESASMMWMLRLGYVSVFLCFFQVVEVVLRVVAFLKTILCRPGDMFDFLLVAVSFACVLYGSTEVLGSSDDSSSGSESGSEEECVEASPFIIFSAILFLRLWRFAKVGHSVSKLVNNGEDKEMTHLSENKPRLFDESGEARERKLELEKSVLAAELKLAKEQIAKLQEQVSNTLMREGFPATAQQLSRTSSAEAMRDSRRTPSFTTLESSSPATPEKKKKKRSSSSSRKSGL